MGIYSLLQFVGPLPGNNYPHPLERRVYVPVVLARCPENSKPRPLQISGQNSHGAGVRSPTAAAITPTGNRHEILGRSALHRGQVFTVLARQLTPQKRAVEMASMSRNITIPGCSGEEGKTGEDRTENPRVTCGKWLEPTHSVTCVYEFLLKACASRQEKLSFCRKNGAARHAHIPDPRGFFLRRQEKIARPAHLHALSRRYPVMAVLQNQNNCTQRHDL
jgi:hypothetical protein